MVVNGVVSIFFCNLEDLLKKYFDILVKLYIWVKSDIKSFVFDCEIVVWDVEEKKVFFF